MSIAIATHCCAHLQHCDAPCRRMPAGSQRFDDSVWICAQRSAHIVFVILASMLMTACGAGRLVQPGTADAGGIEVNTPMAWSRFAFSRYQIWTIDGIPLNRLYFIPMIRDGEHVFLERRASKRRPDGPVFRQGMRADEIRDLVLDAFSEGGAVGVASSELKPARFGDRDGLRFDFQASTDTGLLYRGKALAAEHDGGLALVVWMAPAEYYFERDAARVSQLLDSARLTR